MVSEKAGSVEILGQGVQLRFQDRAFRCSLEQGVKMFRENWVTIFVMGFWVKALGEANVFNWGFSECFQMELEF